jgi:hypothetical protein
VWDVARGYTRARWSKLTGTGGPAVPPLS